MSIELQVFPSLFDIFFILTRDEWDLIIETVTSSELELSLRALKCVREIVMIFNPRLRLLKIHSSIIIEFIF